MADITAVWNEAGKALGSLGLKLKLHYEQQRDEIDAVTVAADDAQDKEAVETAVAKLGAALQDAFDALGAASHDDAVKEDVKQVGRTVSDALSVTFAEVSDDVRAAFESRKRS
jgi:Flp pilus assembly pilin Flp